MNTKSKSHWKLTDDVQNHTVSTVKLPVNHGTENAPVWYETLVFPKGTFIDLDGERYETQEQAEKGHEEMVRKWRDMM